MFSRQTAPLIIGMTLLVAGSGFAAAAQDTPTAAPAAAQAPNPKVGGAEMLATKTIPENASAAPNLTTLVTAAKAAGLVDTLAGPGPFTVFAPTNDAFSRLAPGTVDTLLKPENKATLTKILTYHVVPGKLSAADLTDGKKLKTVQGDELTVKNAGGKVTLTDAKGGTSTVTIANVNQSNGVIHVVDTVLMPAS